MMTQDDRRTDGDIRKWSNGRKDVEICGDLSVVTYFGVFLAPDLKTRFSCSTVETSRNRPVFAFWHDDISRCGDPRLKLGNFFQRAFLPLLISLSLSLTFAFLSLALITSAATYCSSDSPPSLSLYIFICVLLPLSVCTLPVSSVISNHPPLFFSVFILPSWLRLCSCKPQVPPSFSLYEPVNLCHWSSLILQISRSSHCQ